MEEGYLPYLDLFEVVAICDIDPQRLASFSHDGPFAGLPVPGVYARHNAVDTPALLPDGSISELSLNRVLVARDQVTTPTRYTQLEDAETTTDGGQER